jgi:hypothetical protein
MFLSLHQIIKTMARTFKPFTYINHKYVEFNTYRDFKKQVKSLFHPNYPIEGDDITVFRHRRGEWGEWVEKWQLRNGKPVMVKAGWN